MNQYQIVTPSLRGVLTDAALSYEGIRSPSEVFRIMDRPRVHELERSQSETKVLEEYFSDMYGLFMKKLSHFVVDATPASDDTVKLEAMLQELIKVKRLMGDKKAL